ncbi:MAG TPA: aminotransferase class I/II-fold pyridoxal phosphate-dependent enzyme, partial [Blastocatellia bacterium]
MNNTPNHDVLHKKLAALENAEAALVTASGMAAISSALLTVLSAGDHLIAQDCLYGGTHDFVTQYFKGFGIEYDLVDGGDPDSWKRRLKPNTKAIYVESMSNPLLQVPDHKAVVAFAKQHGLVAMIDNTFATPINFRPLDLGFDLSIHSCTKYMNGHSDIAAGACIGGAELVERIRHKLNHFGGSLDPHAVFLLHRGVKTLALRMRYHNESALKLAQFFESHPTVKKVNYPGLESHSDHPRARELFGGFGGMMSIELDGDVDDAERFIHKTTIPYYAPSLGGVETLITRPATTSHAGMSREDRYKIGISDSLIRISVGIEATEDLIEDFSQALNS